MHRISDAARAIGSKRINRRDGGAQRGLGHAIGAPEELHLMTLDAAAL
jgi:hypothetical protein